MRVLLAPGQTWSTLDPLGGRAGEPSDVLARALAQGLHGAGHTAEVVPPRPRPQPPFRDVMAPLADARHECDLAAAIRAGNPDVVHVLGCGGGTSIYLPWVARSLGVPCTVEVTGPVVSCHRGDLVHADGSPCHTTEDPVRCARCCRTRVHGRAGLTAVERMLAQATRWLGDLAPFPTPLRFRNRRDLIASQLGEAEAVIVPDQRSRDAVAGLGVADDRIHLVAARSALALLPLWERLVTAPGRDADDKPRSPVAPRPTA